MFHHSGGSKFYEVFSFWNMDTDSGVMVSRWGKMAAKESGGQMKIDQFNSEPGMRNAVQSEYNKREKRGYEKFGVGISQMVAPKEFAEFVRTHYKDKATVNSLCDMLKVGPAGETFTVEAEAVPAEPIDHGEGWGTW